MNKDIIKTYSENGFSLNYRESDNYVNATQICKLAGKNWADYFRLKETKTFLDRLSIHMGIPISKLVHSHKAGKYKGTYIHELIAYNLAQWCSPEIAVFVAKLLQAIKNGEIILLKSQFNWKKQRFEAKDSNNLLNEALHEMLEGERKPHYFSNEARMICKIVTGKYPSQIVKNYQSKYARDILTANQLAWIDRLQRIDSAFIQLGKNFQERKKELTHYYQEHKDVLFLEDTINSLPITTNNNS